jgi:hypothetical protein
VKRLDHRRIDRPLAREQRCGGVQESQMFRLALAQGKGYLGRVAFQHQRALIAVSAFQHPDGRHCQQRHQHEQRHRQAAWITVEPGFALHAAADAAFHRLLQCLCRDSVPGS